MSRETNTPAMKKKTYTVKKNNTFGGIKPLGGFKPLNKTMGGKLNK